MRYTNSLTIGEVRSNVKRVTVELNSASAATVPRLQMDLEAPGVWYFAREVRQ